MAGIRGGRFTDLGSIDSGNNFFGLTKDLGWDTIRLRVWNVPRSEDSGNLVTTAGNESPDNTRRVAKAVVGAGQHLAIDLHYADSWADPQHQPKPYAWASLSFPDLVTATYQYTHDMIQSLVDQGTCTSRSTSSSSRRRRRSAARGCSPSRGTPGRPPRSC